MELGSSVHEENRDAAAFGRCGAAHGSRDRNASAENGSGDALNWWQAANVRKLSDFLESGAKDSQGKVLCDAPGLGKTLSVLATITISGESCGGIYMLPYSTPTEE